MNKKGVTVLVCTYNGAPRLAQTLAHLSRQIVNGINWEIIVADNASTDDTVLVAKQEWAKYNLPAVHFTVLTETRPGKINALETSMLLARYKYFIICDDDNWLAPDYVHQVYHTLDENPVIGAVGGQSTGVSESGVFPSWFDEYAEGYAIGKQGETFGDVSRSRGYLWGAGLSSRTQLYLDTFKKQPSFLVGREGEKLTAGEDSEYCQRVLLKGYKLYYDPKLVFKHYMPQNRLETSYRTALFEGFVQSDKILDKYHLITRLKLRINEDPRSRFHILRKSFFKILFTSSRKKRQHEISVVKYLLHLKFKDDPIQQAIIALDEF